MERPPGESPATVIAGCGAPGSSRSRGIRASGRAAWRQARRGLVNGPASANDVRENFLENVIIFDWLRPILSQAERDSVVAGLNRWAEYALGINTKRYQGGFSYADSDALVGYYFGVAATDLATRGLPGHRDWLTATAAEGANLPVGGLTPTAADRSTVRNALHQYLLGPGAGGQWFESSGYNTGTVSLMAMGYGALAPAVSDGALDDFHAFLEDAGTAAPWRYTPDLDQPVQWGDDEHPRDLRGRLFKHVTMLSLLAGVLGDSPGGRSAQGLLQAFYARYGSTGGYGTAEPWPRALLFWDPWQPARHCPQRIDLAVQSAAWDTCWSGRERPRVGADATVDRRPPRGRVPGAPSSCTATAAGP